ncbi:hypothetical protein BMS3Bbin10_01787 [bacterium BMS3Bbin10]|nr:hypothetical protein BMS3Bbin10_01787 [bacterium BMS3Bbin10]
MKTGIWVMIISVAGVLSFLVGYSVSESTGVEPGFFEAVETGSYGAGPGGGATEGVSAEDEKYYQELGKE